MSLPAGFSANKAAYAFRALETFFGDQQHEALDMWTTQAPEPGADTTEVEPSWATLNDPDIEQGLPRNGTEGQGRQRGKGSRGRYISLRLSSSSGVFPWAML